MQKMREVYTQNPKLGDPATIDKQLQENAQKLDKLMLERKKYEVCVPMSQTLQLCTCSCGNTN